MELTPIRVRGKRRVKGEPPVAHTSTRRRIPKQTRKEKPTGIRFSRASLLEMPLEILELIFWYSENVNLPRASHRLGWLLSGRSTLRKTFISAFAPTWDECYSWVVQYGMILKPYRNTLGCDEEVKMSHVEIPGNPCFQSDLLACGWADIDMILDCWDTWVRRYAGERIFRYRVTWDPCRCSGPTLQLPVVDKDTAVREYFDSAYDSLGAFTCQLEDCQFGELFTREACQMRIDVHPHTEVPDELITGPWDEKALRKLFWLVQAGARPSPNCTWELSIEGFHNALSDPKITFIALRLLLGMGVFHDWPDHVWKEESRMFTWRVMETDGTCFADGVYYVLNKLLDLDPSLVDGSRLSVDMDAHI
ncbi:hypothetical protein GGS20DRAFT_554686 [Poronia punctata]|nr:hypothetical protein GGS20DRAFT_554686 [Poronia punctata]